jgi:hypothetical protein
VTKKHVRVRKPKPAAVVEAPPLISSTAFLLRGISSIPGELKLTKEGRLSFVANCGAGTAWGWQLRKIERETRRPGLAKRIDVGDDTVVFDVPLSTVAIEFPWYYFSGGLIATVDGVRYKFSLGTPANMRMPTNRADIGAVTDRVETELSEVAAMRRAGKAWQAAIAQLSVHPR